MTDSFWNAVHRDEVTTIIGVSDGVVVATIIAAISALSSTLVTTV